MQFLNQKEKGCLRFEYGRDWKRFMAEEQIEYIDKSYSISLDTKYSYLSRTTQQYRNVVENEDEKDEENQARMPSAGNYRRGALLPNSGFGSSGGEMRLMREVIVVRDQPRKGRHSKIINQRKQRSKMLKNRNHHKIILDKLLQE